MLEGYFNDSSKTHEEALKKTKRLLAVQAALEVAIASVSSAAGDSSVNKVKYDLKHVTSDLSDLADSIQEALEK